MTNPRKTLSALSRRTILAGSLAGVGAVAFAAPALAAGDVGAVRKLPGEVSRLATATSRTGRKRYEIIDVIVAGDRARLFVPHAAPPSQSVGATMLWYYHARNGTHTALSSAFAYSADLAVDRGIISICPTYGGSIWTSARALEIQVAVAAWASSLWRIDASLLRSDSGGGPLLAWAYGNRLVPNVLGAYLSSSSYDLEERAASEPDKVVPHFPDSAAIIAANPARLPQTVWRGARLRITGSPDDVVVPFAKHGTALHAAALPVAKEATLRSHPGEGTGGHAVPSFTNKEMLDTFTRWLAEGPVREPEPPVTVLPGAGTYENGAAGITTTGTWSTLKSAADSGGSIAFSSTAGASATFAFTGTGVSWVSRLTSSSGINEVLLDGVKVASVDRYSATTRSKQTVWSSGPLPAGPHTVTISRGKSRNPASTGSNLILDAFVVSDATPPATALPGAGTYENGAVGITTTGTWTTLKSAADSGGSIAFSSSASASATFAFTGTGVSWVSRLTSSSGINDVLLDGVTVASVDRYSATTRSKQTVWSSGPLPAGPHTVTISRGTTRNPASTGSNLILDAFVVSDATPPPATVLPGVGTYEDGSDTIVTTGTWSTLRASTDSGGSIAFSSTAGASATFAFTGTGIAWVSRLTSSSGINEVLLDGVKVASVDRYSRTTRSKQTVWSSGPLPSGPHTITISRGTTRNPASSGSNLILDAFVVSDATPPPVTTAPQPVAEWSFAESGAPFASAVAGAPALRQGAGSSARRVTTPFGEGVSFNGSTDHLMVPKTELGPLNLGASTGAVTIAVWVLSSDTDGACLAGVWEESTVGPLRSYALFNNLPEYGGWERVCMHVSKTGGPTPGYPFSRDYSVEPRRITRGVWQLHVGTYDGAEAVSYLDGTATGYPTFTDKLGATYAKNPYRFEDGLNAAPGDFVVGAVGRDGGMINRFKGTLARLRVWDRALTPEQVKELYTAERAALR